MFRTPFLYLLRILKFIVYQTPMVIKQLKMNLALALFLIGILGFILNRKNIILMIIAIEIMLLAVTLLVLISSFGFDDGIGQTFSIFIISIAGAESVIGLSILVAFYRSSLLNLIMVFGFNTNTYNNDTIGYNQNAASTLKIVLRVVEQGKPLRLGPSESLS